jgi:molecular chaperone DnaJ
MVTMADKRDYYEVLSVERTATKEELSVAYRKLALKYHPDRNPGDESAAKQFKEAAEAFEVLSHPDKRARYDRYGHAGLQGSDAPHFRDVGDIFEAFGDVFGDGIFGDLFGGSRGGGRGRRARKGGDVQCELVIDLAEAATGAAKTIVFNRHQACDTCSGSGAKPGTRAENCQYCGGSGRVVQTSGFFSLQTTCPSCRGAGKTIRDHCTACRGQGYVERQVTRKVDIPAGVDSGTQLRLAGEGEPSPTGGPPGDCYCVIRVKEHPLFQREGHHLICHVPITYTQAALGATINVPTLTTSQEELTIPPGTQPGDVFTIRGQGVPDLRQRGKGDLHVQVSVEVPKRLSERHEELLRELAEIESAHVSPKRKSFFDKLKDLFHSDEAGEQ